MNLPDYIFPGAFVRLRDGSKALIYATNGTGPYAIHGAGTVNGDSRALNWDNAGLYQSGIVDSVFDIVGPWVEKPDCSKLWPLLPPWLKWLAADADGMWYAYADKPEVRTVGWFQMGMLGVPAEYAPVFSGDWKDSLCERPQS